MNQTNIFKRIFQFYYEGFKNMTYGRKLWAIILIKLFVMFFVLKMFFFKDFLGEQFKSDKEKSEYVLDRLTPLK